MTTTPKLQGVRQAMALLRHNLEADAEKLVAVVGDVDGERTAVFAAAHGELDATKKEIAEVREFLADIKGTNGAPTLSDSSDTSDQSQPKPEELTVNGVSKS